MKSASKITVRDIMTSDPHILEAGDVLDLADDLMTMARIRHIPVLERGKVVGVLSQRDLFYSALVKAMGFGQREQKDLMKTIRAREVMSQPVVTIAPDVSVKEAARLMAENKIGCLPVVEGQRFIGLVTETDMLRHLASHE